MKLFNLNLSLQSDTFHHRFDTDIHRDTRNTEDENKREIFLDFS